jgi:mannose/cellobiose epimerase-like protein (N-acyl-D-glucosamine 2-epimerase family)
MQVAVALALFSVHARIVQSADAPWAGKAIYIPKLEKNLKENITAFWLSKSLDRTNGGYTINFGPKGEPKGPGTKMIVTQARTLWLFSRLVRAGYGGPEHLEAAENGYRFLKEKM